MKWSARKNPRMVYAALHGYRDGGPYSGQPAYDDVIQGQSGIAALDGGSRGRAALCADDPRRQDLRAGDRRRRFPRRCLRASAPAAASSSKSRCSSRWCRSSSASICSATISCRRSGPLGYTRVTARMAPAVQDQGRLSVHDGLHATALAQILDHGRQARIARRSAVRSALRRAPIISSRSTNLPAPASPAKPPTNGLPLLRELEIPVGADVEPRRCHGRSAACRRRASSNTPPIRAKAKSFHRSAGPLQRYGDIAGTAAAAARRAQHRGAARSRDWREIEIDATGASGRDAGRRRAKEASSGVTAPSRLHRARRVKFIDLDQPRRQPLLQRILRDGLDHLAVGLDAVVDHRRRWHRRRASRWRDDLRHAPRAARRRCRWRG